MSRLHEALQRAAGGQAPVVPAEAEQTRGEASQATQPGFSVPWTLDSPDRPPEQAEGRPTSRGAAPLVSRLADWFRDHSTVAGEKLVVAEPDDKPDLAVAVEQYRKLAATLYYAKADRGVQVIAVTSALPHEGKSLTATNLALTLSESYQKRVLVIDADLRRPSLHGVFGVSGRIGLSEYVSGENRGAPAFVEVSTNLVFLPSGRVTTDPTGGLTSVRMRSLVDEARAAFEWVIIDTPPVGLVSDARLVSEMADGVVLVVEAAKTPYPDIQRAVAAMDRAKIVGVVLNRVQTAPDGYDSYHGYYRKSSKKVG